MHPTDYQSPTVTNLDKQIPDPFTRLDNKTYLHDRPEKDVFKLLIDAFRMRQADDFKFEGIVNEGSVYTGAASSLEDFRHFTRLVSQRPGLFPPWWNNSKQKECEEFGETGGNWSSLKKKVDKDSVISHYSDPRMPMQLRMFAEDVYGSPPAGSGSGMAMRKLMMTMEARGGRDGESVFSMIGL